MPSIFPLAGFKEYLKITWSDDDADLNALLEAAEGYLCDPYNGLLGGPIVMTEFTEEFSSLSDVDLRFPEGAEVSAVTYLDPAGDTQTLGAIYRLREGQLVLLDGEAWPTHKAPVYVTYEAGFDSVPQQIITAGYFYAASLYNARGAEKMDASTMRSVLAQMLAGYRRIGL